MARCAADSKVVSILRYTGAALVAAWHASVLGRWAGAVRQEFALATAPARLRWCATVIGVAAAGHLVLRTLMSATVAPAMPAMLVAVVAAIATLVACQPAAFLRAWRASRSARAFQ